MSERSSRPVSASCVEMTEIIMPNDANPLGNAMGGRVMHWIDVCAAVSAGRHARTPVVTASVDNIDFHNPVPVGGVIVLLASVNYTGRTSMEVGVKVWQSRSAPTGRSQPRRVGLPDVRVARPRNAQAARSAADAARRPTKQKRRYKDAKKRRALRLAHRR